jgi:hypothetical protein
MLGRRALFLGHRTESAVFSWRVMVLTVVNEKIEAIFGVRFALKIYKGFCRNLLCKNDGKPLVGYCLNQASGLRGRGLHIFAASHTANGQVALIKQS